MGWVKEKVREHHNRKDRTIAPLLRLSIEFDNEADATLAEAVLADQTRNAVRRDRRKVTALVKQPETAASPEDVAAFFVQPLQEAHLTVRKAELHSPVDGASPTDRGTWHRKVLKPHLASSGDHRRVLRESSVSLLPAGDHPTEDEDFLWTDLPDYMLSPAAAWTLAASVVVLFLAIDVGLAGSHAWMSPGIVGALLVSVLSIVWWARARKGWRRSGYAIGGFVGLATLYFFSAWVSRTAPGPVQWAPFMVGVGGAMVYAVAASLLWSWLRRSSIAGSTFLAICSGTVAVLGAAAWIPQLLIRTFQNGLGYVQTPLPIRSLDLVANGQGATLLAGLGIASLLVGVLALRQAARSRDPGSTAQVIVAVPAVVLVAATFFAPLVLRAWQIGDEVRRGDLAHADGIAACVTLSTSLDQALANKGNPTGVLVGPISGPALFIDRASGSPKNIALPGDLTAQVVANSQCPTTKN